MTDLERLVAEAACRDVVLATATAVDARDYAALAALFCDDAVLVRPDGQATVGRAAIEQVYTSRDPDRLTRHVITNHRVVVLDTAHASSHASSICTVLLWSGRHSDAAGLRGRPADAAQLLGEFDDRLILTPAGWRIAHRTARFVLHSPTGMTPTH